MDSIQLEREDLAVNIARIYDEWVGYRKKREEEWTEARKYIFATSTRDTTNNKLPWKNSTTRPKLTQIRDNLHANYMAAEFSTEDWLDWVGADADSDAKEKAETVKSYVKNKLDQVKFRSFVSRMLLDWIDYGNCFAGVEFVEEYHTDPETGERHVVYVGAKPYRISPLDIVFNPTASSFEKSPKIVRTLKSMGDLIVDIKNKPEMGYLQEAVEKGVGLRTSQPADKRKNDGFKVDGFGSYEDYLASDMVEILDFYGNYYDKTTGEVYENVAITVVDRSFVARKDPIKAWDNSSYIFHVGWRERQDNLWAMSPLDNLIGMQYRIDHLENIKADVFDMIAHPITVEKGDLEFTGWKPGGSAQLSDEASIDILRVDSAALQADLDINMLEQEMENMAGAPKNAMGIRTPGEKTAFEVQSLDNAANRIFLNKLSYFEEMFLEPLLNSFLELSRRNLNGVDVVKVLDNELEIETFMQITKDDITASGKLRARGARHLANKNKRFMELLNFNNSILQDPNVSVHISGKRLAKITAELLGEEGLFEDNVRVYEQMETQEKQMSAQEEIEREAMMSADMADAQMGAE